MIHLLPGESCRHRGLRNCEENKVSRRRIEESRNSTRETGEYYASHVSHPLHLKGEFLWNYDTQHRRYCMLSAVCVCSHCFLRTQDLAKREAVADEDYDKASEIKGEVDSLRAEIEEKVKQFDSCISLRTECYPFSVANIRHPLII